MRIKYIFLSLFFLILFSSFVFAESSHLGIPIFPKAKKAQSVKAGYGGIDLDLKVYQTSASFEKVVKFYKQKLPQAMFSSTEERNQQNAIFQLIEGESTKVVIISRIKGENVTRIDIMRQF